MRPTKVSFEESDLEQFQSNAADNPSQTFKLSLVQEPSTGKAVSSNLRARGMKWPIEPPPVLELTSPEKEAHKWLYIHNPNWFCIADLVPVEIKKTKPQKENKEGSKDNLSGLLASSLHKVKNPEDRNEHGYFVFGDLNVRDAGRYRLEFTLFEMRRYDDQVYAAKVDSIVSKEFEVQTQKSNIPTRDSTKLSKTLSEAGVKIRLRKESTKRKQNTFNWSATASDNLSYGASRHPATLAPMVNFPPPPPVSTSTRSGRSNGEDITRRLSVVQTGSHTPVTPTNLTSPMEGQNHGINSNHYYTPSTVPGPSYDYSLQQQLSPTSRRPVAFQAQRDPTEYHDQLLYQPMSSTTQSQSYHNLQASTPLPPHSYQALQSSSQAQSYQAMQPIPQPHSWGFSGNNTFRNESNQDPHSQQQQQQTFFSNHVPPWDMSMGWNRGEPTSKHSSEYN